MAITYSSFNTSGWSARPDPIAAAAPNPAQPFSTILAQTAPATGHATDVTTAAPAPASPAPTSSEPTTPRSSDRHSATTPADADPTPSKTSASHTDPDTAASSPATAPTTTAATTAAATPAHPQSASDRDDSPASTPAAAASPDASALAVLLTVPVQPVAPPLTSSAPRSDISLNGQSAQATTSGLGDIHQLLAQLGPDTGSDAATGFTLAPESAATPAQALSAATLAEGVLPATTHSAGNGNGDLTVLSALQQATALPQANAGPVATPAASSTTLSAQVGTPAFAGQLSQHVSLLVQQEVQQARIQVSPPGLGTVDIHLDVSHGVVNVAFAVQHPEMVHAIQQTLPQLDSLMSAQGLQLGQTQVGQQQSQSQSQSSPFQQDGTGGPSTAATTEVAEPLPLTRRLGEPGSGLISHFV